MSDARRRTLEEQAEEFAGKRAAVCRCQHCRAVFISEKLSSKWCSAGCRKAAFVKRHPHAKSSGSVIEEVFASAVEEIVAARSAVRCVHCGGKVRSRLEEAICGMCGLNFDGA